MDEFERAAKAAREQYQVLTEAVDLREAYVEAQAGTGSRYVVVATVLPADAREREDGRWLVSVVWPWQDCKVVDGQVEERYVMEHLTDGKAFDGRLHGGDMAALTLTVRRALSHAGAGIAEEMIDNG